MAAARFRQKELTGQTIHQTLAVGFFRAYDAAVVIIFAQSINGILQRWRQSGHRFFPVKPEMLEGMRHFHFFRESSWGWGSGPMGCAPRIEISFLFR